MSSNRRRSAIWRYFQETKEDKKSNWICVLCKTVGSCKNTSNQWKHLGIHHKAVWDEIRGQRQPPKKRRRQDDNGSENLLDNDSERIESDTNAGPSISVAAHDNTGASTATSASANDNAGEAGPHTGAASAPG
jgi:hypothetical protein